MTINGNWIEEKYKRYKNMLLQEIVITEYYDTKRYKDNEQGDESLIL